MSKPLKRGANRKINKNQSFLNFSFLSGLFFGIFISFSLFVWKDELNFSFLNKENAKDTQVYPRPIEKNKPLKAEDKKTPTFYKFLSTEKVPIPKDEFNKEKRNNFTEIGSEKFYLQIGSFKNIKDADARKARLALLGISTKIEETVNREGGKWYRVQLGPVSRTIARDIRKKIYTEGFEVLVTKK